MNSIEIRVDWHTKISVLKVDAIENVRDDCMISTISFVSQSTQNLMALLITIVYFFLWISFHQETIHFWTIVYKIWLIKIKRQKDIKNTREFNWRYFKLKRVNTEYWLSHIGNAYNNFLVNFNALQVCISVEVFIVVMYLRNCIQQWGKSDRRYV